MTIPSPDDQVKFLVNLQRLLSEGSFVATYKYALVVAIADLCIEKGDDSGAPLRLRTRDLAEKFILMYWPQAAPYVPVGRAPDSYFKVAESREATVDTPVREAAALYGIPSSGAARVLKQNTGRQAKVLRDIEETRARFGGSLFSLRANARAWRELVGEVTTTVTAMPLWKLQKVGRRQLECLYHRGADAGQIELLPGVTYCFRRFHALVRDLVQAAWLRFIRRLPDNTSLLGEAHELGEFLFGSERANLDRYRPILRDVQRDECFYCRRPLRGPGAVDHFIPWSVYHLDLGHNFVLAHTGCNNDKSDRVAAIEHLERWCERNVRGGDELDQRFDNSKLLHDLSSTWQVTRWAYDQAEAVGSQVWVESRDGLTLFTSEWKAVLDRAVRASSSTVGL